MDFIKEYKKGILIIPLLFQSIEYKHPYLFIIQILI